MLCCVQIDRRHCNRKLTILASINIQNICLYLGTVNKSYSDILCVWHEFGEAGQLVVRLVCTVRWIPTDAVDRVIVLRYPAGIRDFSLLRKVQVVSQGVGWQGLKLTI